LIVGEVTSTLSPNIFLYFFNSVLILKSYLGASSWCSNSNYILVSLVEGGSSTEKPAIRAKEKKVYDSRRNRGALGRKALEKARAHMTELTRNSQ
jgi:hypothetical protein